VVSEPNVPFTLGGWGENRVKRGKIGFLKKGEVGRVTRSPSGLALESDEKGNLTNPNPQTTLISHEIFAKPGLPFHAVVGA